LSYWSWPWLGCTDHRGRNITRAKSHNIRAWFEVEELWYHSMKTIQMRLM
jgi:hypothetical protein